MYRLYALLIAILLSVSGDALASSNTLLPDVKALALDKLVLDRSNAPISVIETSPITNSRGEMAQGMTEVTLTLDASAKNAIVIQGKTLAPGKSLTLVQDLSVTGGSLKIPVYPATSNLAGVSKYTIDIPKITVKLCADGYTHDKSEKNCFKVNTAKTLYQCPDASWKATGDLRNCLKHSVTAKETCPSGFNSNGDGTCSKSEFMATAPKCDVGYSYSSANKRCEKADTIPAIKICPSGWADRGSYCSRTTTSRPSGSTCPRGYIAFDNDDFQKNSNGNIHLNSTTTKCFKIDTLTCKDTSKYWLTDFNGDICHTYTKKHVPLTEDCPADYPYNSYWNKPYNKTCGKATPVTVPSICKGGGSKHSWGEGCAFPGDYIDVSPVETEETTSKSYSCSGGWSLNGSTCSRVSTTAMTNNCPTGTTNLNNGSCSQFLTGSVDWICRNPEYVKLNNTTCEKASTSNLTGVCPSNYVKNGNKCELLTLKPAGESCPVGYTDSAGECIQAVYSSPNCKNGILSPDCSCAEGTSLNLSSRMCEGIKKTTKLKTCPVGFTLEGDECKYVNQVNVVYYYCPAGMTNSGSTCVLDLSIPSTVECNSPYKEVMGKCQFTDYRPLGSGGGVGESRSFEGRFVTETSSVELANTEFDALVSEINEVAIDVAGGCRLVSSESKAQGAIGKSDVTCAVNWKELPIGITGTNNTLKGIFAGAGTPKLVYELMAYNGSKAEAFKVAEGEITVEVKAPVKPEVIDITSRLMNKVVRGFEVHNYDSTSKLVQTAAIVEPKNYEQLIEIENVGECTVVSGETSCNIYSSQAFERDESKLTFDSVYKVWANSKVGGWDKSELTSKDWTIHHDFRGPAISFSEFNASTQNPPIVNEELGFPVTVKGGEAAVGISNFRPELGIDERWWKPTRVKLEFKTKDEKFSVNTINVNGNDVVFDVPNSSSSASTISNYRVYEELGGNAYPFSIKTITPGVYTVKITAKDYYNNESETTVENIVVATPSPQIKILHKKRPLSNRSTPTINMLDDVMIVAHNGFEGDSTITSVKIDGKEALTTNGDNYFKLLTGEGFDLAANQTYKMEVEARDTNGAVTESTISFNYLRMMFGFQRKPKTVIQLVENVGLKVSRTQGLRCDIYGTKSAAALAASDYKHACFIEWTTLPNGLTSKAATYQASAVGGVSDLGNITAAFNAYIVNKAGKANKIVSDEITFESIAPQPIQIELDKRLKLAEGIYSIPVTGRQIGRYQGTSSRANIDVELSNDSGDIKRYKHNQLPFGETQNFSAYADKLGGVLLWDKVPYQLKGQYRLAPEMSDTFNFDLVVTPHPYMQVLMDLDSNRYASTESIKATIKLGIKNNLTNTFDYNVQTMGVGWDVYIAFKKGAKYEPITKAVQIGTDGKGVIELDADIIFNRNEAIYAIAEARSPYPEIEIQRVSTPRSITIVKGTAVEGEIVSRIVHSRIPANFDLRFDTKSFKDFMVMGDIKWQRNDGSSWVEILLVKHNRTPDFVISHS